MTFPFLGLILLHLRLCPSFGAHYKLVNRYLNDNQCQHGLYLVGWFNCEQWDGEDYRQQRAKGRNLEETRQQLENQAWELSSKTGARVEVYMLNTALR